MPARTSSRPRTLRCSTLRPPGGFHRKPGVHVNPNFSSFAASIRCRQATTATVRATRSRRRRQRAMGSMLGGGAAHAWLPEGRVSRPARMAQSADAEDSKSSLRKGVRVRIPLRALARSSLHAGQRVAERSCGARDGPRRRRSDGRRGCASDREPDEGKAAANHTPGLSHVHRTRCRAVQPACWGRSPSTRTRCSTRRPGHGSRTAKCAVQRSSHTITSSVSQRHRQV